MRNVPPPPAPPADPSTTGGAAGAASRRASRRASPLLLAWILALPAASCAERSGSEGPGAAGADTAASAGSIEPLPIPPATWPGVRLPAEAALALVPGAEQSWGARALEHAPRRFLASGWADARTLWGLAGTRPVLLGVRDAGVVRWSATAWEAALSPEAGFLAWLDERGLWVGRRGAEPRLVLDRSLASPAGEGDLSGPLLWSPGADRILVRWTAEWNASYAAVDAATGAVTPLSTRLDGYALSDAFGWLDPHRVLFATQAMRDRQGRSEYREGGGYRGDLMVHDLRDGRARLVTSVADGTWLRPLAPWGDHGVLVGEAVGDRARLARYWIYDTRDWTRRPIDLPPGYGAAAHDTTRVVVMDRDPADAPVHRLWLWEAGRGTTPLAMARGRDLRVRWGPQGDRIALSTAVEAADPIPEGYHTWVLEGR